MLLLCQFTKVKTEATWANSFELHSSYSFRAYNVVGNEDTNREGQIIREFTSPSQSDVEVLDFTFYYATEPVWVSVVIDSLVIIGPPATLSAAKPRMGRVAVQAKIFRNVDRGVLFTTGTATATNSPAFVDFWTGEAGTWEPYAQSYGYWALVSSNMFHPEDGGDPLIGQEVRTVGASLLITNTSPQATQGGIIHTARLKGKHFHEYSLADFAMTRGYSSSLQAAQGVYTFVVPEEERLRFQAVIEGGYHTSPRFDLSFLRTSYVHGIIITSTVPLLATTADVDAGTAGVAPSTFRYTIDEQFEFQTSSRRYNARPHSDSITDLDDVLCMFNRNSEWFYENPQHLEKLYAMLKGAAAKAWRGVKFALPYAAPALTAANPALGPLIHALQALAH